MEKNTSDKQNHIENFPPIGALMVSKMVAEDHKKPLFMYREKRTRKEDSGWRIFSGLESQEYTENPANTGIYHPSTILKIDSSIADLLLKGVGSVFERLSEESPWYPVADFELEDDFMVTIPLSIKWELTINNLFEQHVEENGGLFFTTGDKSLRLVIWNSEKDRSELQAEYQEMINKRDTAKSRTENIYDFSDSDYSRIGYSITEANDRKEYEVIYGFTIVNKQVVQAVFYYDDKKDKDWALNTWKCIKLK